MDGDKRKRKMMENVAAEEEETEEEKIENFYALIRSTKDLRDRMAGKLAPPPQENNNNKATGACQDKAPPQSPVGVWNPSFRPEDFVEEYTQPLNIVSEATAGPSGSKDKQQENNNNNNNVSKEGPDSEYEDYDHRHNLDLNLSL
ncbi:PREDICTED: uncharacterized protein LOC109182192 isoform X2 [Ipomoea nil]|uniref:uncharacterized protein LOC109182192 isoform X1 n=1 Tax=Ipomoea nil TaxID=35883 RepID=UPI000900C1C2|nr:PREDICTED: uncharacterized protein LOC109182192 isoform X1 [Ipomoea nil]XP_019187838.1 PREDICTED: uncharacterized protein LOC109182192 isoform X2 [Ipomoea nil]